VVLDSGDGVTHLVPVYEGFALPHSIKRSDVAGRYSQRTCIKNNSANSIHRNVTEHLQLLLRKAGHTFQTSAEKEIVRSIKEKCGYVALNPLKEEKDTSLQSQEFVLPDGKVIKVIQFNLLQIVI
jgi:centractin